MLLQRSLVVFTLLPLGLAAIYLGGWFYWIAMGLFLFLAAREYGIMFRNSGHRPAIPLIALGTAALLLDRALYQFAHAAVLLSALVLFSMLYHLIDYERGGEHPGTDFGITLGGILYLGWIGAYLISLRNLNNGLDGRWWTLIALMGVWLADIGAYLIGKKFGKHPLCPRLSPMKTIEGYVGGILFALVLGTGWSWLILRLAGPNVNIQLWQAILITLAMGIFTALGDVGESMLKREASVKDSSNLLPGHGGAFDFVDSWLWAGVISYYLVQIVYS